MNQYFKNFRITITRFKMASTLNIVGLSVAIAVFITIMTQLHWEYTYNKSIDGSERIYRGVVKFGDNYSVNMSRPRGETVGNSTPEIECYAMVIDDWGKCKYHRADRRDAAKEITATYSYVSSSFLQLASLELTEGDAKDFEQKDAVIVPVSFAEKMWDDISPIGQILYNDWSDTLRVVGVYKDIPNNIIFNNVPHINAGDFHIDNSTEWGYRYYYKLTPTATPESVRKAGLEAIAKLNRDGGNDQKAAIAEETFNLEPFEGLFFSPLYDGRPKGNKTLSLVLLTVAILIITIAVINYINFFMALVPIRIRSVNINKVFGTPTSALRLNFIIEAVGIMVISFILALLMVEAAASSYIAEFTYASLKLSDNGFVIICSGFIMVIVGIIAGLFPALYITKFSPAMVLKGSFGRSKSGQRLRTILTAFQFVVSTILIIAGWFIILQTKYMREADYGFDRDRLITVNVGGKIASQPTAFLAELRKNPSILDVAYGDGSLVNVGMGWGRKYNGENMVFQCFPVSWNYPTFMGMELIEGRFFIESDALKTSGTIIFNETAAKRYGIKVGDFVEGHSNSENAEVVGIVKDFNFQSLSNEIGPLALYEFGSDGWRTPSNAYIRITPTADFKEVSDYISKTMIAMDPNFKPEDIAIKPFDQNIENLYKQEQKISDIISLFSIVAMIIALVGILGLVVFETQYRKREIALRRIHGSSVIKILLMFNRRFIYIVLGSFVVAAPLAWYAVSSWLDGFAYRIPIYIHVFVLGLLIVLAVTVITVTLQTLRAATRNPIDSIKPE